MKQTNDGWPCRYKWSYRIVSWHLAEGILLQLLQCLARYICTFTTDVVQMYPYMIILKQSGGFLSAFVVGVFRRGNCQELIINSLFGKQ